MIEVLAAPFPATVQDRGRPGYRHLGVPLSGALDPEWLAIANALAGNPPQAAALEMRLMGPRLRCDRPTVIGLGGEFSATILDAAGNRRRAASWRSHTLAAGEILDLGAVSSGVAYLAIGGGLALPPVLGSLATYARAGLGGFEGRALRAGDWLAVMPGTGQAAGPGPEIALCLPHAPQIDAGPLRVLAGPQQDHFTAAAWQALLDAEFTVSREADRMGLRLAGPQLKHDPARGADIVSDGVTPGAIQVPGDGRPIVLLADCQTVGGYPKIATVIAADLRRLGHLLPGQTLRFAAVNVEQAVAARRTAAEALAASIAGITPVAAEIDLNALYGANLIDGVIDASTGN